uniref:Histone deacetylase n=1 Tax=Lygus hesperus TaxID=30085 RepID=A0A0A9XY16_LYGHE
MKRGREEEDDCLHIQVGYVYDENLVRHASKLSNIKGRALVVQKLIESYDLLRNTKILKPSPATEEELCSFHSSDYIGYLKEINTTYTPEDDVTLEFGIGYDCPPLDGIFDYCCAIGGATLTAAKALNNGEVDVAINWFGGWHHAQRDEADGFCYVNDAVLGILELRKCFNFIVYVDLDVHHGNGVEAGFERTPKVLTVSFHQFESGFYPGTGSTSDVGTGTGQYHSLNVPLQEGIGDVHYCNVFDRVWCKVLDFFEFDAVVVQCGADGLSGDPLGGFNLTQEAYGHCLRQILMESKPTLILGGGGYNIANTARCWAYLTSLVVGCELDSDIPEHDFFSMYGPSYELAITPSHRKDTNSKEYVDKILKEIEDNLSHLSTS